MTKNLKPEKLESGAFFVDAFRPTIVVNDSFPGSKKQLLPDDSLITESVDTAGRFLGIIGGFSRHQLDLNRDVKGVVDANRQMIKCGTQYIEAGILSSADPEAATEEALKRAFEIRGLGTDVFVEKVVPTIGSTAIAGSVINHDLALTIASGAAEGTSLSAGLHKFQQEMIEFGKTAEEEIELVDKNNSHLKVDWWENVKNYLNLHTFLEQPDKDLQDKYLPILPSLEAAHEVSGLKSWASDQETETESTVEDEDTTANFLNDNETCPVYSSTEIDQDFEFDPIESENIFDDFFDILDGF